MPSLGAQDALIHLMVAMAAADGGISDTELRGVGALLATAPVFAGFDLQRLPDVADRCREILASEDGLADLIAEIAGSVPVKLHETAYALAVEIAASDTRAGQPELRLLQMLRDDLDLDPLATAAIERSARVRYRKL